MKKFFFYAVIFFSCIATNEFLVERKVSSVKEAQEVLCSLRVDIMRLIVQTQVKIGSIQQELGLIQGQFQEDFFSFATGDKSNVLSSKDKRKLNEKVCEARILKEKLIKIQSELVSF